MASIYFNSLGLTHERKIIQGWVTDIQMIIFWVNTFLTALFPLVIITHMCFQLVLILESVWSTLALLSGKKRKPAWTDRILWRIKPKTLPSEDDDDQALMSTVDETEEYPLLVIQDKYTCDMSYGVSDHKPVIATFSLEVRGGSL